MKASKYKVAHICNAFSKGPFTHEIFCVQFLSQFLMQCLSHVSLQRLNASGDFSFFGKNLLQLGGDV